MVVCGRKWTRGSSSLRNIEIDPDIVFHPNRPDDCPQGTRSPSTLPNEYPTV